MRHGKSEPLPGARGEAVCRRVRPAEGGRRGEVVPRGGGRGDARRDGRGIQARTALPVLWARGALEGRVDVGLRAEVATPVVRGQVQLAHGHGARALQEALPRLGLLRQANAPQRADRMRRRGLRPNAQDRLRVAPPQPDDGVGLPVEGHPARRRPGRCSA